MPSAATILLADDDPILCRTLKYGFEIGGLQVFETTPNQDVLDRCDETIDLVVMNYQPPGTMPSSLLHQIKKKNPDIVIVAMLPDGSIEHAVSAMRDGAYHVVRKPFALDEISLIVEKGLETTRLIREMKALHAAVSAPYSFDRIIGESAPMLEAKNLLRKVAASPLSTVLLYGESGTGKDIAAKAIHYNSGRSQRLFMNITCSALPEALLESELFGHEQGSFTDAKKQKKGLLELAEGGTVFLDEFTEMSPALQAKLLRFLEDRTFKRVGGVTDIHVDVRVIAATNRPVEEAVETGVLRRDLYYRLQVLPIRMPPLRERKGDIPLLADFFIANFNREFKKKLIGISPEVLALLESHTWAGNVREFRNAFERAILFHEKEVLTTRDFPLLGHGATQIDATNLPAGGIKLDQVVDAMIANAWDLAKGNQTRAAALLGITRDRMRYQIEKLGLQ